LYFTPYIFKKNIFFEKNARTDACYFDKASCVYVGVHARAGTQAHTHAQFWWLGIKSKTPDPGR